MGTRFLSLYASFVILAISYYENSYNQKNKDVFLKKEWWIFVTWSLTFPPCLHSWFKLTTIPNLVSWLRKRILLSLSWSKVCQLPQCIHSIVILTPFSLLSCLAGHCLRSTNSVYGSWAMACGLLFFETWSDSSWMPIVFAIGSSCCPLLGCAQDILLNHSMTLLVPQAI